jgi:putative oxidoreductase
MKRFFSPAPLWQTTGLTLIRLIVGFFMMYHGYEIFNEKIMNGYLQWDMFKNSSTAKTMVYIGKATELIGGILLFLGLFTRIACFMIMVIMSYIAFFVGHGKIWYQDQNPFLLALFALLFFFTGPGNFSLDKLIFKKS